MGKDKKEKKVNDIQETDCYQEGDTTETIPDEDTGCTNESQELTELEAELQKVREERDLYLSMAQRLQKRNLIILENAMRPKLLRHTRILFMTL